MKKKILSLSVIAICLAIITSGTLAYFSTEEKAHNVITTGSIGIEIVEKMKDESGIEVDFPKDGIGGVMPGQSVSKIVSVKNNGEGEAWIRIKVDTTIENGNREELPVTLAGNVPALGLTIDPAFWVDGQDGYYYYVDPVAPAASTEVLFEQVRFAPQMGNEYQNCTANILVSAQAVQVANNPIPAGGDVTDVKGWPMEGSE